MTCQNHVHVQTHVQDNVYIFCFFSFVELNRSAFLEQESLPKPKKSLFVRQKLMVSVGEIVNGEPPLPVTRHVPVCSFNGENKYRGENAAVDLASSTQKAGVDATGKPELVRSNLKGGIWNVGPNAKRNPLCCTRTCILVSILRSSKIVSLECSSHVS